MMPLHPPLAGCEGGWLGQDLVLAATFSCEQASPVRRQPSEHFHFENALTDDGASLVRANEE